MPRTSGLRFSRSQAAGLCAAASLFAHVVQHHAYVKCLNARGMHVTELPDASGWTYADNDQPVESTRNKIDKDCTMEAFGGRN